MIVGNVVIQIKFYIVVLNKICTGFVRTVVVVVLWRSGSILVHGS